MALSAGSHVCETCQRRFWPTRDRQRYACDYCGRFPGQVRIVELDHQRHPHTRQTRPIPVFDPSQCTCTGEVVA
jgi:hypothetical protein